MKIKSTMPITNKDEKERREKTRRVRKKREIEHHKTLNHPSNPKLRTIAGIKHHKTLNKGLELELNITKPYTTP
jgi:hypothetical protein